MNEASLQDLKQFITATISQQLGAQSSEMHGEMKEMRSEIKANIMRSETSLLKRLRI